MIYPFNERQRRRSLSQIDVSDEPSAGAFEHGRERSIDVIESLSNFLISFCFDGTAIPLP